MTARFPSAEMRRVSQMRDACRSAKQNIHEGYKKESPGEFAHSIRISRGSLEEFKGDWEDCLADGLISKEEYDQVMGLVKSADYMSHRYLLALNKMQKDGSWKLPRR